MKKAKCPKCGKVYKMGYNGVVEGCDKCLGIQRDRTGMAWRPDETEVALVSASLSEEEQADPKNWRVVKRADAFR